MTEDERFEADEKRRIATLHKTAPETIWLQIDPEAEQFDWWDAQTWCSDQINDTDLKYVRTDVVEELRQQLAAKDETIAHCHDVLGYKDCTIGHLERQIADLTQTSFDLCQKCGWRTLIPEDGCIKCESVESVAEQREAAAELGVALAASRKLVASLKKGNLALERQLTAALAARKERP